jgi:hypothetical protein
MAGPNAGFVVSVDEPLRIDNPTLGQTITVAVRATATTKVKGILISALFDPSIVEFLSYSVGDITPSAFALPKAPQAVDDGLSLVDGGSTILGSGLTTITSGGLLGTFQFEVIGVLPEGGSGIWVTSVEVNISADPEDEDVLTFAAGELGVTLVRRFANRIFNTEVTRRFDGATVAWESRFVGLADTLLVRAAGDSLWRVATAVRVAEFSVDVVEAARLLFAGGVPIADGSSDAIDSTLEAAGMGPPYTDDFLTSLVSLNQLLLSRRHVVSIDSLSADTQYEYEARSTGLAGSTSNSLTGFFRTRLAPDLRPAAATDLDVQTTTASASWFTNRPADTRLLIEDAEGNEVASIILDPEGTLVHAATIGGLTPDTEYTYFVTSRLIDEDVTVVKTGTFRTRASREPLRLLSPPARVVSPETAVIQFRLNQIALATVAYGEVSAGSPDSAGSVLYEFSHQYG